MVTDQTSSSQGCCKRTIAARCRSSKTLPPHFPCFINRKKEQNGVPKRNEIILLRKYHRKAIDHPLPLNRSGDLSVPTPSDTEESEIFHQKFLYFRSRDDSGSDKFASSLGQRLELSVGQEGIVGRGSTVVCGGRRGILSGVIGWRIGKGGK